MEGSVEDVGAPESWEAVDLEESVKKLMLRDSKPSLSSSFPDSVEASDSASASVPGPSSSSSSSSTSSFGNEKVNEDVLNQVDPFLREALQNPRERLSVLRMEQDVQKFLRDPTQEQLEFQQLPTSYLRLAAHRVAQHYSLQSMVLLDNSLPDGSGSRIIVCKTSECRLPAIRLADIPINLPAEDGGAKKFAIKQRPQKHPQTVNYSTSQSVNSSSSKSVEERKEEYNKARAKIFSSADSNVRAVGKSAIEPKVLDNIQHSSSLGGKKVEEKLVCGGFDTRVSRGSLSSTMSASRPVDRIEKEPVVRHRLNNKVAIFRDRDVDRRDPDYDRNYERYMQRFDPGFGFSGGAYAVQPMYSPAVNYNTEFPQLGSPHRPQISSEPQPRPLPQHLSALWAAPSTATGLGYGHPDTIGPPFNPNHVGARSASSVYLQSPQYPCQQPVMPFLHQSYAQSPQQQSEMNFGLARPR